MAAEARVEVRAEAVAETMVEAVAEVRAEVAAEMRAEVVAEVGAEARGALAGGTNWRGRHRGADWHGGVPAGSAATISRIDREGAARPDAGRSPLRTASTTPPARLPGVRPGGTSSSHWSMTCAFGPRQPLVGDAINRLDPATAHPTFVRTASTRAAITVERFFLDVRGSGCVALFDLHV